MNSSLNTVTTAELAVQLHRCTKTIKNWRRLRVGPPYIVIRGRVLYDLDQVRAWLAGTSRSDGK